MRHLSRMTMPHWMGLYGTLLIAWGAIWALSMPFNWATIIHDICMTSPDRLGLLGAFAMWLIMSAAMMLPTTIFAFATFDDIADAHKSGGGDALVTGYLLVWVGFSAIAAIVQIVLTWAELLSTPWLAPGLLVLAAAYQISAFKDACLSKCRHPLTFFMAHWDEGPWKMGLRLGLTCLGCCWALMALGLIGGTMSVGFMALATVLMAVEKLSRGVWIPYAIGLACLAAAGYMIGDMT